MHCSLWLQEMTPKEKRRFEEMAEKDKARYDREMASYVPPKGAKAPKRKRTKDPNAPKRALWVMMLLFPCIFTCKLFVPVEGSALSSNTLSSVSFFISCRVNLTIMWHCVDPNAQWFQSDSTVDCNLLLLTAADVSPTLTISKPALLLILKVLVINNITMLILKLQCSSGHECVLWSSYTVEARIYNKFPLFFCCNKLTEITIHI